MKQEIDLFFEYLKLKNASQHTLRNYKIDLDSFCNFLQNPLLKEVDRKNVRTFLAKLHDEGKSKKTCARKLSTLRSFFKYALFKKWIETSPLEDIDNPKLEKKLPPNLSYEQVKVLFNQPDLENVLGFRDRVMMELFYSSALRVSELAQLNLADIDFSNGLIKLQGKGKKERIVPITPNASDWIQKYLSHPERPQNDAVFLNKYGERLTVRSIDRQFQDYLKRSGLAQRITPHTIRHTIATHWLENGMNLKTIQLILGHSNLATTTLYTQVSTKLKKKVYDDAHPRAREKV